MSSLLSKNGEVTGPVETIKTLAVTHFSLEPLGDSIIFIDSSNAVNAFPAEKAAIQTLSTNRKEITQYITNPDTLIALKPSADGRSFGAVWNVTFAKSREKIVAWERGKKHSSAVRKIRVSGKTFNAVPNMQNVLMVLTQEKTGKRTTLYLVNAVHGAVFSVLPIFEARDEPAPVLMMKVWENVVVIGIHYPGQGKDKLVIIEICTAEELADMRADYSNGYKSGRTPRSPPSEAEMTYSLKTALELDWQLMGLEIFGLGNPSGEPNLAVLDQRGNIHLVDFSKYAKGDTHHIDSGHKVLRTSENFWVPYPTKMWYHPKQGQILVAGTDLYSFTLP